MQRAVRHKVLGRGRPSLVPCSAPRARVLTGRRAGADVLRVYVGKSAAAMEESYRAAIERIVELGGRDAIVAGKSPLAAGK